MMKDVFKTDGTLQLKELAKERLVKIFDPYDLDFDDQINIDTALDELKALNPSDSAKVNYQNMAQRVGNLP